MIGLLTYHHVVNEGAFLQAYALYRHLKSQFGEREVEVINYRSLRVEVRDFKTAFSAFPGFHRAWSYARAYLRLKAAAARTFSLSPASRLTDDYAKALELVDGRYQAVVVGSDEVWKLEQGRWGRKFPNLYWLSPELPCRKIAFAASANRTDYKRLSAQECAWLARAVNAFALIGVRDAHTVNFLTWLGVPPERIHRVPDPTFLLETAPASEQARRRFARYGADPAKPLAGILLPPGRLARAVAGHFRARGFCVVAAGHYQRCADVNVLGRLTPFEWAEMFSGLSFCVTNRFHPTIFSMKCGVPFLTIDLDPHYARYASKTRSLLEECGLLEQHLSVHDASFSLEAVTRAIERIRRRFDGGRAIHTALMERQACANFLSRLSPA